MHNTQAIIPPANIDSWARGRRRSGINKRKMESKKKAAAAKGVMAESGEFAPPDGNGEGLSGYAAQ